MLDEQLDSLFAKNITAQVNSYSQLFIPYL